MGLMTIQGGGGVLWVMDLVVGAPVQMLGAAGAHLVSFLSLTLSSLPIPLLPLSNFPFPPPEACGWAGQLPCVSMRGCGRVKG